MATLNLIGFTTLAEAQRPQAQPGSITETRLLAPSSVSQSTTLSQNTGAISVYCDQDIWLAVGASVTDSAGNGVLVTRGKAAIFSAAPGSPVAFLLA